MKELREKLDTTSDSLSTTEARLRGSEERGREGEEEAERLRKELAEENSRAEQLKVSG